MRTLPVACLPALLFALAAVPVRAAPGTGPALHASVAVVSDYRARGISYSDGDPALQGEVHLGGGGWFASAFGSSVQGLGGSGELDFTAGLTKRLPLIDASFGATLYSWPGSGRPVAPELFATASLPLGPATATVGATWSPADGGPLDSSRYFFGTLRAGLPLLPVSLKASVGHEAIAAVGADGRARHGKWDWQLGGDLRQGPFTLGVSYARHSLGRGPLLFDGGRFESGASQGKLLFRLQAGF